MSSSKYEERVAMLVMEFDNALMALPGGDKVSLSDALFAFAKLSVQREAEIIIEWMDNYAWTLEGKQEYLISKGLIPPKTETV